MTHIPSMLDDVRKAMIWRRDSRDMTHLTIINNMRHDSSYIPGMMDDVREAMIWRRDSRRPKRRSTRKARISRNVLTPACQYKRHDSCQYKRHDSCLCQKARISRNVLTPACQYKRHDSCQYKRHDSCLCQKARISRNVLTPARNAQKSVSVLQSLIYVRDMTHDLYKRHDL
jgi:hypothetical protein